MTAPTPADTNPATEPGPGITKPRVPAWVTDPNLIADILCGYADIPDDLMGDTHA